MTQTSLSSTSPVEALTSEERWSRWQQRGFENDARFKHRFRLALAASITVAAVVLGLMGTP